MFFVLTVFFVCLFFFLTPWCFFCLNVVFFFRLFLFFLPPCVFFCLNVVFFLNALVFFCLNVVVFFSGFLKVQMVIVCLNFEIQMMVVRGLLNDGFCVFYWWVFPVAS